MATINNISTYQGGPAPVAQALPTTTDAAAERVKPKIQEPVNYPQDPPQDIEDLADELASNLKQLGQGHTVSIRQEEGTNRPIVEVRNQDGKLLNQFPPEKVLNLRRVLADLSGVVINRMT